MIVNLTSGSVCAPTRSSLGAYAAVKEAIAALTRAAAVEWGPDGIRVVALDAASRTATAWTGGRSTIPTAYAQVLDEVPLGRIGDPETDIGRAAVWLCSARRRLHHRHHPRRRRRPVLPAVALCRTGLAYAVTAGTSDSGWVRSPDGRGARP